jgi:tRNA threonylcarbamoyladenosine biosynthesis protein TsaE
LNAKEYKFRVSSVAATQQFAADLAMLLFAGSVVTLDGELGSGKTTFTQGLARGLGVSRVVNSPTFTIIKEYTGRLPLHHMDVYRLADGSGGVDFDEYFYGDGVTVIEWASNISGLLPDEYLSVQILTAADLAATDNSNLMAEDERILMLHPFGAQYEEICEVMSSNEDFSY